MIAMHNQILNKQQTLQKIKRLAYQIYEHNFDEETIVFAGIHENGKRLADRLQADFQQICSIRTESLSVYLDKFAPQQSSISLDYDVELLENKTILLVDDVLNTGRTLAYSLKPFLNRKIKKLQTVVLVDRGHRLFPVTADFVGYSLSTTVLQHVNVVLDSYSELGVYLY